MPGASINSKAVFDFLADTDEDDEDIRSVKSFLRDSIMSGGSSGRASDNDLAMIKGIADSLGGGDSGTTMTHVQGGARWTPNGGRSWMRSATGGGGGDGGGGRRVIRIEEGTGGQSLMERHRAAFPRIASSRQVVRDGRTYTEWTHSDGSKSFRIREKDGTFKDFAAVKEDKKKGIAGKSWQDAQREFLDTWKENRDATAGRQKQEAEVARQRGLNRARELGISIAVHDPNNVHPDKFAPGGKRMGVLASEGFYNHDAADKRGRVLSDMPGYNGRDNVIYATEVLNSPEYDGSGASSSDPIERRVSDSLGITRHATGDMSVQELKRFNAYDPSKQLNPEKAWDSKRKFAQEYLTEDRQKELDRSYEEWLASEINRHEGRTGEDAKTAAERLADVKATREAIGQRRAHERSLKEGW